MSALTVDQVTRIQLEVMSGVGWEGRSAQVPGTAEARKMWDAITRNLAEMKTAGVGVVEVLHEIPAEG